ncbi:hypothetical protein Dimus_015124 [Dionaea muscipula]
MSGIENNKEVEGKCCSRNNGACNGDFDGVVILDHGDPKMFIKYWEERDEECSITISGSQLISYFSSNNNLNCWFLEPELANGIRRLHQVVGNAVTDGHHIVVGTGSSQLYQAALYALSLTLQLSSDDADPAPAPVNVVSAAPYYSSYPVLADFLRSGRYKWAGDANAFGTGGPFIEVICSPCNPDGARHEPVVVSRGGEQGKLIHDLAYYWPQYTPITEPADHDLMLFTMSKCTGHAGSRIGWALVRDEEVAKKMIKFVELNTIGTSKEAELRAAKILQKICDDYQDHDPPSSSERFFEHGHRVMAERWQKLRDAMERNGAFTLKQYPNKYCQFMGKMTEAHPAFAWLESKKAEEEDGAQLLRKKFNVTGRRGVQFGVDKRYVRVSMVDADQSFDTFVRRLSSM